VIVRTVLPGEAEAVGTLRVDAYQAQGMLAANPAYAEELRVLGFGGHGTVLVASDDGALGPAGKLLGTVMYEPWHPGSEVARSADEAEVRALAVTSWAQGRGVGRALMLAVIGAAETSGISRLLLSTRPEMKAAQHLYRSLGFTRAPGLDWSPVPGITLLGFAFPIRRSR
jgi:ribosomal protein S18 acetylase RimI-like enzyme